MKGLRNMMDTQNTNPNHFQYTIHTPVPIGEKVWTFWTDCCMACYFQPRDNKPIQCGQWSPCHTMGHGAHAVRSVELKYANLGNIIDLWGKKYFYTEQEARDAVEKLIKENIVKMRELGYKINEDGFAEKEEGWEEKIDD